MPLFFVISGSSAFYALKKRTANQYIKERLIRLGAPLVLGVFILSPPQVYIERVSHEQFNGSFLEFFPYYFDGWYLEIGGLGNFAFVGLHLWYLFVLLVFTLLTTHLFKSSLNRSLSFKYHGFTRHVFLLFLLSAAASVDVVNLGGWDITFYILLFAFGFYSLPHHEIGKNGLLYSVIAILSSIIIIWWFYEGLPQRGSVFFALYSVIRTLSCMSWLMIIFNAGKKFLSKQNSLLNYGSAAALPFYVIHQPVVVLVGYLIRDINIAIPFKLLILIVVSFSIIGFIYHWIIRVFPKIGFLFGANKVGLRYKFQNNFPA